MATDFRSSGVLRTLPFLFALLAAPAAAVPDPAGMPATQDHGRLPSPESRWQVSGHRYAPSTLLAGGLAPLRQAMAQGDKGLALTLADGLSGSEDAAVAGTAQMVLGWLHRESGRHQLAAEAFTRAMAHHEPLQVHAGWFRAEQLLQAGLAEAALHACDTYQLEWKKSPYADQCYRLMAQAHAELGHREEALDFAQEWDEIQEGSTLKEQVMLSLAHRQVLDDPHGAARQLSVLSTYHRSPVVGQMADALLKTLAEAGEPAASSPRTLQTRKARAVSLRDSRRKNEAWAAFERLKASAADDPALQDWIRQQTTTFAWRTHRFKQLADEYASRHEADPNPEDAWQAWRAYARAGHHQTALRWIQLGLEKHGQTRRWQKGQEDIAREALLAGSYEWAAALLEDLGEGRSSRASSHRFYAAFAHLMAGHTSKALRSLTDLIESDSALQTEARYWRSLATAATDPSAAVLDRAWILKNDPDSWYALLVRQLGVDLPAVAPFRREGRWPSLRGTPQPLSSSPLSTQGGHGYGLSLEAPRADTLAVGASWPYLRASTLDTPAGSSIETRLDVDKPPAGYPTCIFHQPEASLEALRDFAETWGDTWPELHSVVALAEAGLHDLSGPSMARWFERWQEEVRAGVPQARAVDREMKISHWRQLFFAARDHHHASRHAWGLHRYVDTPEQQREVRKLELPLAHASTVWPHAREHDVDPYLVLGLMRVESLYDAGAVSRVGALGPMQIMPRTGNLLAALTQDHDFTTADLHDPELAVRYGITYLGLLMERFDGAFPLAVAAYNAGPHNVSAWTKATGFDMPIDAWVEHIPLKETRRYVRSVSATYQTYVGLYEGDDFGVLLPDSPRDDDPSIVDF